MNPDSHIQNEISECVWLVSCSVLFDANSNRWLEGAGRSGVISRQV